MPRDTLIISRLLSCCVAWITLILPGAALSAAGEEAQMLTIVDFGLEATPWRNIDDVVMGGVSSSRMRLEEDVAVFEGRLSLENNGGFASVRSDVLSQDLAGYTGVRVRVKGDGRTYQFRIHTAATTDSTSYQMSFETEQDNWLEADLPFSGFIAGFRGRPLPNHPPIDPAKITTLGLLVADRQQGDFRLEIDWVRAYRMPGEEE